jgi:hypothetical protein
MFRSFDHHQAADSGGLPPDDDRMIETCCGINIGRGEEELLR